MPEIKTVSIFADTGNIFHCIDAKYPGRRLNYKKFLSEATHKLELETARAYGTYVNPGVADFEQSLIRIGWETKFYPPRSQGQPFDWAVEIALEIHECKSDVIILGSSGHEYFPLLERLRDYNDVEIVVMACGINDRMRSMATDFRELNEEFLTDAVYSKVDQRSS